MIPWEDSESLALLYHLNSEPWKTDEPEPDAPPAPAFKQLVDHAGLVNLPESQVDSPLNRLIQRRRSCRSYRAGTLPLSVLAELLRGSYGVTHELRPLSGRLGGPSRSVPSAGGLYPLQLHVAAVAIDGLAEGLYHYNVLDHSLAPLRPGKTTEKVMGSILHQEYVQGACGIIIFTAIFRRTLSRYGARGYRYILLEAGHAAQNVCLIATQLGLGTLCVGGFSDSRLNQTLDLDGRSEAAVYCVAFGHPAD
jgi:SagB-type dehydrogenase family enzyme